MDNVDYQQELCLALNLSTNELTKSYSIWRFNVLHVRGLDALTSEDVYEYFQRKPHSIEWLSNISCNVTFGCINEAFESLISIAKAIIIHKNDIEWRDNSLGVKGADNLNLTVELSDSLEIPVPPNYRYVMGEKHPKAKTILIRFATINDRKNNQQLPDTANEPQQIIAARPSSPTNLSSNVPLRRVKRNTDEQMMDISTPEDIVNNSIESRRRQQQRRRRSMPPIRMRMRADEEEERIRQQRQRQQQLQRSSNDLRSRLSSNRSFSSSRIGDRIQPSLSSNNRIMKAKRTDSIWRRTIDDTIKNRMRSVALDAKTGKKYTGQNRNVGDLRTKLNEPIIRVQVTYDDEEIRF